MLPERRWLGASAGNSVEASGEQMSVKRERFPTRLWFYVEDAHECVETIRNGALAQIDVIVRAAHWLSSMSRQIGVTAGFDIAKDLEVRLRAAEERP